MITIYRYVEVFYYVIGDPSAKVAAKRDIQTRLIPSLFLFAATIESGYYYFGIGEQCNQTNDRPIWYCLTSWISWAVLVYFDQIIFAPKYRCVEISVPMNVHFCVHRYGEWFMLMFGESIISLLIVDANNENINYSVAFYSGILSVILLAHLHFGSIEPHSIDSHALSRSRHSSYMYTIMVPIYSAALIAIGVSYKLFLYEFKYQNYGGGDSHRKLDGAKGNGNANDDYAYQEKRQQFAADLFSGSIATVLLCADFIQLLHLGLPQILKIARRVSKFSLFLFITLKYSLVVLLASLSTMQNDPHVMAFCGLGAFFFQEFLYNQYVFRGSDVNDEGSKCLDDATWHTVTTYSEGFFEDDNTILATFEQLEMHNCNLPVIEEAASKCERDEDASSQGTANGDTEDGTGYTTLAEI